MNPTNRAEEALRALQEEIADLRTENRWLKRRMECTQVDLERMVAENLGKLSFWPFTPEETLELIRIGKSDDRGARIAAGALVAHRVSGEPKFTVEEVLREIDGSSP